MLRCRQRVPPLYVRLSFQTSQDEERLDGWGKGQVGLKERNGKGINIPFSISHSPHPSHPTFACILCLKTFAKDCDEMFAKERDWALTYGTQIRDASEKFSAVANARLRLIQQLGHLAGALSITVAGISA